MSAHWLTPPGQIIGGGGNNDQSEPFRYYYHPDHLGSTSYITDATGEVYQHLEYFAFGETFVEEQGNTDNLPYKFNGKELDEETGLYYYGARYYDAKSSVWLSVDPLAEKYPSASPYSYVLNNPIKFVDLWGLEPTPEESAEIADHIYTGKVGDKLIGGWEMTEQYESEENPGYQAGLYKREKDNGEFEYVMANAGTDPDIRTRGGRDDVSEDFEQPFGGSEHMILSIQQAKKLDQQLGQDVELTFVGHSKGGAEAAGNALATNRNAIVFNPAAINSKAYGFDSKNYTGDMTAYIVNGDILNTAINSWFARPIDKAIYLPKQSSNPITNHLMPAVKSALKEYYQK